MLRVGSKCCNRSSSITSTFINCKAYPIQTIHRQKSKSTADKQGFQAFKNIQRIKDRYNDFKMKPEWIDLEQPTGPVKKIHPYTLKDGDLIYDAPFRVAAPMVIISYHKFY